MVMPVLSEAGHEEQQQKFVGEQHERPPCQIGRNRFSEYKEHRSRLDRSGTRGKDGPLVVAEVAMVVGENLQDIQGVEAIGRVSRTPRRVRAAAGGGLPTPSAPDAAAGHSGNEWSFYSKT